MSERIEHDGILLALVIRASFSADGITFFTPPDFSQQLAYMNRPAGHLVKPHIHREVPRRVTTTQEVLLVRSGRVRVSLFASSHAFVQAVELGAGDVILLAAGGHGVEMLERSELIEVKQGPFSGDQDKQHFEPNPRSSPEG